MILIRQLYHFHKTRSIKFQGSVWFSNVPAPRFKKKYIFIDPIFKDVTMIETSWIEKDNCLANGVRVVTIFVVLCRFTDNFEEFKRHAIPTKHFNDNTSRNNSTPQQITNIIATKLVFLKEINFQKLIFFSQVLQRHVFFRGKKTVV